MKLQPREPAARKLIVLAMALTALFLVFGATDLPWSHLNTVTALLLWLTAPGFMVFFGLDRRWSGSVMGQSLMVMAGGIWILATHGVAFQLFGPGYWGRDWFVPIGRTVVLVAFLQRIWALWDARRREYGKGLWWKRIRRDGSVG